MLDGQFRSNIETWVKPIGQSVRRSGVSADVITVVGIVMAVFCAVAVGAGAMSLGLLLLILAGIPDLIDGAVAKAAGSVSPRGAFLDSVSDRLTDGLLYGGVAWYFATNGGHRLGPLLPFAVYVSASLVSYIRAKADALGFDARGGLIERAERFIILGLGLLFVPLLVAAMWLTLVLNLITAGQRFVKVWGQASSSAPRPTRPARRRGRATDTTAAERWRQRRVQARARSGQRRHGR